VQRVARRARWPRRLAQPGEQDDGAARQRRRAGEGGRGADPADQHSGERRAGSEGDGAGKLDAPIGRGQRRRRHQGRDQRWRCDVVGNRAAGADEAEQRQQLERQEAGRGERQHRDERQRAQQLGRRHEAAPRHAVGQHAGRDREQQEGQRLRGLQQPGLAGSGAEREHGDDRRRGEADLLGRLRGEVGPGEAIEARRQDCCGGGAHGWTSFGWTLWPSLGARAASYAPIVAAEFVVDGRRSLNGVTMS